MFTFTNSERLMASFQKRECAKIILSTKYSNRCCCGLSVASHSHAAAFAPLSPTENPEEYQDAIHFNSDISSTSSPIKSADGPSSGPALPADEHWNPLKHTIALPTDAYGFIDFRDTHTNKAQYIRLAYDTKPDFVLSLLLRDWCLEKPKLLITVTGGKANFDLQPKIKWCLRKGLLKAAKTTGAWLFTGGLNTGVNKHVGDALVSEKSPRMKGGRVASIGIAPWGVVERRGELIGMKKDVPFHTMATPKSRFTSLNKHHAYFLLVDNGTVGKYGAEMALRRKLERFISTQNLGDCQSGFFTPLVCLVIEGGTNTVRAVLEYVTASPPVPVVVCDGTGRAADLLAFAHKYTEDDGDMGVVEDMRDDFLNTIKKTFRVSGDQAARLYVELQQCMKRKHLITIFRCSGGRGEKNAMLDEVILTALLKAQYLHPSEQLSLALTWNRSDIARKEIFTYGQDWPPDVLEHAMQEALELDRVDFVILLLEQGVNMNRFLTLRRLENLYNSKRGPPNTLNYLVRDVVPRMSKGYRYSIVDVGFVINQLMGSSYASPYSTRKYRSSKSVGFGLSTRFQGPTAAGEVSSAVQSPAANSVELVGCNQELSKRSESFNNCKYQLGIGNGTPVREVASGDEEYYSQTFEYPFSDLIVWAVLTKRQEMAKLMWRHGEQNLAKALVASRLYQAMALEAADDDLDVEIYDELTSYSKAFEDLAFQLLEYCYQAEDELTEHLLTASLENWSRQTSLKLAVIAKNMKFLAHPLSQAILADLWMGGLRMRKNPGFKIVLGLLVPPTILKLEFKTKEELELMPQTEEELLDKDDKNVHSSSSSTSTLSRRSSINAKDLDSLSSLEMGKVGQQKKYFSSFKTDVEGDVTLSSNGRPHGHSLEDDDKDARFPELYLNHWQQVFHPEMLLKKKTHSLKWKKKLYEFYAAPITKYYCHSIAYVVFLLVYSYICLVRKDPKKPSIGEWYVFTCMINFLLEKVRQVIATEPIAPLKKIQIFLTATKWNIGDVGTIFAYLVAFVFRLLDPVYVPVVHVVHSTIITYWYIRSLKLIGANKYFGPFVMMIGKMIEHMIYFVVLLLVVLMAFGVCRQAILYPEEDADWRLVRHVFYQPYFMLYGEVFAGDIDPECDPNCLEYGKCEKAPNGSLKVPCHPGRWVTPIVMTIYLLVANLLLLNLLIATFNTIYNSVSAIAQQFWHFQRFTVVIEFEEKPILPAPLTFISHLHRICKYVHRRCKGHNRRFETGLKVVLSKYDLERLYDFEEECAESLLESRETARSKELDERVKHVQDLVEDVRTKMDDLDRWETATQESATLHEYRLQRMEDIAEQTASNLAVIHRFIATRESADPSQYSGDDDDEEEVPAKHREAEEPVEEGDVGEKVRFQIGCAERHDQVSPVPLEESRSSMSPKPQHEDKSEPSSRRRTELSSGGSSTDPSGVMRKSWTSAKRTRRATESSGRTSEDDVQLQYLSFRRVRQSMRKQGKKRPFLLKIESDPHLDGRDFANASDTFKVSQHLGYQRRCGEAPHGDEAHDGSVSEVSSSSKQRALLASKRRVPSLKVRNYTSITDDLEQMIVVSSTRNQSGSPPPKIDLPSVRIEAECLHDAEETDYNLMEKLIERRLRRDSSDLQASLEDLATKSIKDDASSVAASLSDESTSSASAQSLKEDLKEVTTELKEKPKLTVKVEELSVPSKKRKKSRKRKKSCRKATKALPTSSNASKADEAAVVGDGKEDEIVVSTDTTDVQLSFDAPSLSSGPPVQQHSKS